MSKELKEQESKELSPLTPNQMPEGLEEMDATDITIPRAQLVQGSSAYIKNPDDYPDIRVGMVVNNISATQLTTAKDNDKAYPIVPVKMFKSWCSFKEDMTLDVKTYDRNHPLALGEDAWKYKQLNFLCFQPGEHSPIIFTFWKTSYKVGQDIINIAQMLQKPLYHNLFYVSSKNESKDGNDYRVYTIQSKGEADKTDIGFGHAMYAQFNPILNMMKDQSVVIADEGHTAVKLTPESPPWSE